jgi:phosphatidylglycerol:prolipoprotein diacylglycerol transferase
MPRHPSQLYEGLLEGVVLFTVMWLFTGKKRPVRAASGLFVLLYGCFRFLVEFVRQPDEQLGYLAWNWLTMGQLLSLPMILVGAYWLYAAYAKPSLTPAAR